jgi:hypothetical protein
VTPPAVIFEADASSRFHGRPRRQKVYPFPSPPGLGSPSPVQAPRFRFLGGVFPRQVLSLPQERASVSSFWFWSRRVVLRFDFAIACHQGRSFPARVAHSPSHISLVPVFVCMKTSCSALRSSVRRAAPGLRFGLVPRSSSSRHH